MEFLRTPDPATMWAATPVPADSTQTPPVASATTLAPLDRAGIKSSFQQLFTPNVGTTPSGATPFFTATPAATSGLTPFLNSTVTPNLVTPGLGMTPMVPTPGKGDARPSPDVLMSSPYLQAAAKEAVRREFLNMPTYIAPSAPAPQPSEQRPGDETQPEQQSQIVYTKDGQLVPEAPSPSRKSPQSEARVPEASDETNLKSASNSPPNQRVPQATSAVASSATDEPKSSTSKPSQQAVPQYPATFYLGMHPQGMFIMPPNAQMMMPPPPHNAVFMHPNMMMFAQPGAAPPLMPAPPGMMKHSVPPHMAPGGVRMPAKPESATDRKQRVEREKQELIREFKKKTREAALVRFRQKRRERRFGKLIRYECRKQLADARPRVKGRFVRIKTGEQHHEDSESAQVVPSL